MNKDIEGEVISKILLIIIYNLLVLGFSMADLIRTSHEITVLYISYLLATILLAVGQYIYLKKRRLFNFFNVLALLAIIGFMYLAKGPAQSRLYNFVFIVGSGVIGFYHALHLQKMIHDSKQKEIETD